MTVPKKERRCGTCRSWARGGVGVGRGGGRCIKWRIVKNASNKHHAEECWEE